jgi:23S rRNA pseudouridine1911/1915/1917 synthase
MIPSIIFENENFLIIDKPSGLVVHPYDHSTEETLLDFLYSHSPSIFTINNEKKLMDGRIISLGGLVHKLDRDTSGVMVIAKNEETFAEIKHQFTSHTTKKTYIALVEGLVADDSFRIDGPLGRNKKDYKQSVNPTNPRGELREAITDVKVLARGENMTLVELSPITGRTHQLRAHMAHIGHPIVGDKAYGSILESPRVMLHAKSLSFNLLGENYTFEVASPFTLDTMK